jgi:acetyl esterase/lipase
MIMRYRITAMSSLAGVLIWAALSLGAEVDGRSGSAIGDGSEVTFSKATYTYKRVGDCDIKVDVYRSPGKDVRPVIVWIHGGALIFGDRGRVRPDQLQRYLQAGYVVVSIDYRLAPETKLPDILEDLRDAYSWVREKGPELFSINSDRIALVGNSAGGYLTLMAGFSVTPRPKALVSFYGYGDISGAWTIRPDPHYLTLERVTKEDAYKVVGGKVLSESPLFPRVMFYNYTRQNGLWAREVAALDPDKEPEKLEPYSPIRHVTNAYPPTLLLHGDKDTDVPFEESARMAAALKEVGVPHQLIRMHNYDHLFDVFPTGWTPDAEPLGLKDPKVAAAYDDVVAFLRKHIAR